MPDTFSSAVAAAVVDVVAAAAAAVDGGGAWDRRCWQLTEGDQELSHGHGGRCL